MQEITQNYQQDIIKSRETPLLIELSKKDLNSIRESKGLEYTALIAKEIYNQEIKNTQESNMIFIDGAKTQKDHIVLFDTLLDDISFNLKDRKNLQILKESLKASISIATSGLVGNMFGDIVDKGVEFVTDSLSETISDNIINSVVEYIDISDTLLSSCDEIVSDILANLSTDITESLIYEKIYLTNKAKNTIEKIFDDFREDLTPAQSFNLALKLILSIAIGMPKIIFIKDPHKLDKNSLAILSLLFSYLKDKKDQGIYTGVSVIYAYEDKEFQPYKNVDEEYIEIKKLLDEQRLFTQRYAMLERPTSDIPHIAVKSSVFVGRNDELERLKQQYYYSKEYENITTLEVISASAGIGKTKLVKKHIEQIIKDENDSKIIQLSMLNQVGHSSLNTGISSLIESILQETQRLETLKNFTEKSMDTLKDFTKNTTLNIIKSTLGVDKLIDVGTAIYDRTQISNQLLQTKENTFGDMDDKSSNSKEEQFEKLNIAITQLQKLGSNNKPIVLFVDDIQWIDDTSSEYILEYLSKNFNLHIVATLRPMDATTSLTKAKDNKELNLYTIKLLDNILNKINIDNIETNILELNGLDNITLTYLISQVIEDKDKYSKILSASIINHLNSNKDDKYVNTLFAVETINMLCDEKLYRDSSIQRVILNKNNQLSFNTTLDNFEYALNETFTIIQNRYEKSFTHSAKDIEGKFNLMAYAVLEERLNILKIYFKEYGDTAVNTLLFSSLLGTPFSSEIVKNILEKLSTTTEPLLQPLKNYLVKSSSNHTLTQEHYEIIEEVYEILSRYISFNSAYSYRHNLLNIFLDKQLEYLLDEEILKENTKDAKNKLFEIILDEIEKEEKKQKFYGKEEDSLDFKEFENMLFFQKTILNIAKKGFENDYYKWTIEYVIRLNSLILINMQTNIIDHSLPFAKQSFEISAKYCKTKENISFYISSASTLLQLYIKLKQIDQAIKIGEEALKYGELCIKEKISIESYFLIKMTLSRAYVEQGKIDLAISLDERFLDELEILYLSEPDNWSNYLTVLSNLSYNYFLQKEVEKAINIANKLQKLLQEDKSDLYLNMYPKVLNNLSLYYSQIEQIDKSVELSYEALDMVKPLYEQNKAVWSESYILILSNLAGYVYKANDLEKAKELCMEGLRLIKPLFHQDNTLWSEIYINIIDVLSVILEDTNEIEEAIKLRYDVLDILHSFYQQNSLYSEIYASWLYSLANNLTAIENFNEAIDIYNKANDIMEVLYNDDPKSYAEQYLMMFGQLLALYIKTQQQDKVKLLEITMDEIRKKVIQYNPNWLNEQVENMYELLKLSYYDMKDYNTAILLSSQIIDIYNKQDIQNKTYLYEAQKIINILKSPKPKENATFIDLLYLSKMVASLNDKNIIDTVSFNTALGFVILNDKAHKTFSQIININNIPPLTNGIQYVAQAKELPKILYDEKLKDLVPQLQNIFTNDEVIGVFRY